MTGTRLYCKQVPAGLNAYRCWSVNLSSLGSVCVYRRSCFPTETAARTERRAAHHHRLCVNHPHTLSEHNISSCSIRIRRSGGPGAHLHLSTHSTTAVTTVDTRRVYQPFVFSFARPRITVFVAYCPR